MEDESQSLADGRYEKRLASLPTADLARLASLAVRCCPHVHLEGSRLPHEGSPITLRLVAEAARADAAVRRLMEARLAQAQHYPRWIFAEVLGSPDLLAHVIRHVPLPHCPAAVCKAFATQWAAKTRYIIRREILPPPPLERPSLIAAAPNAEVLALYGFSISSGWVLQVVERQSGRLRHTLQGAEPTGLAMSCDAIYVARGHVIASYDLLTCTTHQPRERRLGSSLGGLALAPPECGGDLYALCRGETGQTSEIARIDPHTLEQIGCAFGHGRLSGFAYCLAVGSGGANAPCGPEVYVGCDDHSVAVFGLDGTPRRVLHGAWRVPRALSVLDGRLCVLEAFEAALPCRHEQDGRRCSCNVSMARAAGEACLPAEAVRAERRRTAARILVVRRTDGGTLRTVLHDESVRSKEEERRGWWLGMCTLGDGQLAVCASVAVAKAADEDTERADPLGSESSPGLGRNSLAALARRPTASRSRSLLLALQGV